ncbi:hypothetical protein MASR2M15_27710 [Anaerolineales bacterium]
MTHWKSILILGLALLLLTACSGPTLDDSSLESTPDDAAARTVIDYLQAKIDADTDRIGALLCSEMESFLERESKTFETVSDARLDGATCSFDGDSTVSCEGQIIATYGTEDTEFGLGNYRVVEEDGEWKWCGEA